MLIEQSYPNGTVNHSAHSTRHTSPPAHGAPVPTFPDELTRLHQWTGGRLEDRRNPDGTITKTKVPYSPITGKRAAIDAPGTWGSLFQAWSMVQSGQAAFLMLAFVEGGDLVFTDLDDCRDPETSIIEPWAIEIIEAQGTFAEPSISGTGVHTIGRAKKPGDRCRNWKHDHGYRIEVYERGRFAVMTGNALPGHEAVTDTQAHLDAFYKTHWVDHQQPAYSGPAANTPDMDSLDLIEKASSANNGPKFLSLMAGDLSLNGGDHSAADMALCSILAWWTKDPAQILDIWRQSGLCRAKTDRNDYAERTIDEAIKFIGNAGYEPGRHSGPRLVTPPAVDDAPPANLTTSDLWAMLKAEQTARIAAEKRADTLAIERSGIMHILRNGDLGAERLTAFALALDLHGRIANGEEPTPIGFKAPAKRYAEMTGQSESTVSKHMRLLSKSPKTGEGKDLIPKCIVKQATDRQVEGDTIDHSSGEVKSERETVRGLRDVNYVSVPEGKVINLIDRLRSYQRPEEETGHGGKREARPACEHHPDAGTYTVKHEHIECAACHAILEKSEPKAKFHPVESVDDADDESTGSKMTPEQPPVVNVLSGSKMTPEPDDYPTADVTGSIMQPDPLQLAKPQVAVSLLDRVRGEPPPLPSDPTVTKTPTTAVKSPDDIGMPEQPPASTRSCPNCHRQHSGDRAWCPGCIAEFAASQSSPRRAQHIKNRYPGRETA